MAAINWNAPTIALTVNAILVGLAGLASLSGDDSALPPKFKTDNVHVVRALGHEHHHDVLDDLRCRNKWRRRCARISVRASCGLGHIQGDDVSGGVMNFCIAMMHFYFGFVWKDGASRGVNCDGAWSGRGHARERPRLLAGMGWVRMAVGHFPALSCVSSVMWCNVKMAIPNKT